MFDALAAMPILDLVDSNDETPPVLLKTKPFTTCREIKLAVAKRFGLKFADMSSGVRKRRITRPRQVAMALAVRRLKKHGYSLPMIAREFRVDHTTVLYAAKKFGHKADPEAQERGRRSKGMSTPWKPAPPHGEPVFFAEQAA